MALNFFIAREGQSLFDLAMMAYGDYTKIFQLIAENPTLNLTNSYYVGKKVYYSPGNTNDKTNLGLSNKILVTGLSPVHPGNIEYLQQENDSYFELEDGTGKIKLEDSL